MLISTPQILELSSFPKLEFSHPTATYLSRVEIFQLNSLLGSLPGKLPGVFPVEKFHKEIFLLYFLLRSFRKKTYYWENSQGKFTNENVDIKHKTAFLAKSDYLFIN